MHSNRSSDDQMTTPPPFTSLMGPLLSLIDIPLSPIPGKTQFYKQNFQDLLFKITFIAF